ncbi:MAG: thiol:disulfide interchange protein DsbA/DsbL [Cellvibrionaceae bacterium]|nr:thiol:disulfide interchange protein DsbA/DsbL [Cellvibrionaceae bacterium]
MRAILAFAAMLFSLSAFAQYEVGKDYIELAVPLKTGSDKIQVDEYFSYSCGHCFKFEPVITQWKKGLADDVELVQTPVAWQLVNKGQRGYAQVALAKAYYAAKALKVLDKVHMPIFDGIFVDQKNMSDEDELKALFEQHGVDPKKFEKVFNSFGVNTQVRVAHSRSRGAKISGTPEIVVDGRYVVSARKAGGQANMLKITDFLVNKIRQEKAAK